MEKTGNQKPSLLKKYRSTIVAVVVVLAIWLWNHQMGQSIVSATGSSLSSMLGVLPPILVLIGLLDVWIDRQTMMKYMGEDAGLKGFFFAFILGSFAAGPLYMAFPIAAILMKKKARYAYIIFFLGVWSSTKLPIAIYEISSFGLAFTLLHMGVNLVIFAIGAILIEKLLSSASLKEVYEKAVAMVKA